MTKFSDVLKNIGVPVAGVAALLVSIGSISTFFDKDIRGLLGPQLAPLLPYIEWGAAILVIGLTAINIWPTLQRRSRLTELGRARFDIRVRGRADLRRDTDISDIRSLIQDFDQVFLTGQSGVGKSALLRYGIVPEVAGMNGYLPVFVDEYGSDWDIGLARRLFDAAWSAKSEADWQKLGVKRPPAGGFRLAVLDALFEALAMKAKVTPVIILDQFDDYQLPHRQKFLDKHLSIILPAELRAQNPFWDMMAKRVEAGRLKLVIATRADAQDGLKPVEFVTQHKMRPIERLSSGVLKDIIDAAAANEGDKAAIDAPADGWTALRLRIETDLTERGDVLPQQLRILFLGLRQLKGLHLKFYEEQGGAAGVEAMYVRESIRDAEAAGGVAAQDIRALLLKMVDNELGQPKTRPVAQAELSRIVADPQALHKVLDKLAEREIIRPVLAAQDGKGDQRWQLDHDYLARSVLAEERASLRDLATLRDGKTGWDNATGRPGRQWAALLSPQAQARVLWARLFGRNRFRYGPYRGYALTSLWRLTPYLVVPACLACLWLFVDEYVYYRDFYDKIRGPEVVAQWRGEVWADRRVFRFLLGDLYRQDPIAAVGENENQSAQIFQRAYFGVDSDASTRLLDRNIAEYADPNTKPERRSQLLGAIRGSLGQSNAQNRQKVLDFALKQSPGDANADDLVTLAVSAVSEQPATAVQTLSTSLTSTTLSPGMATRYANIAASFWEDFTDDQKKAQAPAIIGLFSVLKNKASPSDLADLDAVMNTMAVGTENARIASVTGNLAAGEASPVAGWRKEIDSIFSMDLGGFGGNRTIFQYRLMNFLRAKNIPDDQYGYVWSKLSSMSPDVLATEYFKVEAFSAFPERISSKYYDEIKDDVYGTSASSSSPMFPQAQHVFFYISAGAPNSPKSRADISNFINQLQDDSPWKSRLTALAIVRSRLDFDPYKMIDYFDGVILSGKLDGNLTMSAAERPSSMIYRFVLPDAAWEANLAANFWDAYAEVAQTLPDARRRTQYTFLRQIVRNGCRGEGEAYDALAGLAAPYAQDAGTRKDAIADMAMAAMHPSRAPDKSKAWSALEKISGQSWDGDVRKMVAWTRAQGVSADDLRPRGADGCRVWPKLASH